MRPAAATPGPVDTTQARVLVVDDDPEVAGLLSRYLGNHGLAVRVAADAAQVRAALGTLEFDVVLLDLGLPDADGISLVRELRSRWAGPIIIVSGRGDAVERVVGLELGADDYVSKPFDLRELLARIRSVLRRAQPAPTSPPPARLAFDGLSLDVAARRLRGRGGEEIELTTGEFELLRALVARPLEVLSRDELMNAMHGRDAGPYDRAIDMQVGRLRRKLEVDPGEPRLIRAVRGSGYMLAVPVARD
jgi:two-component system OmpR family response regulator